jgi:TonB family protein
MHTHRCSAQAHKAAGAWVLTTGLGFAALIAMAPASAQAPASGASAPSEAVQRQASSPYRFILQNANAPTRAKPEQAAVARPAPVQVAPAPAVEPTRAPEPVAAIPAFPEPIPAVVQREVIPVQTDGPKLPAALLRERPSGVVRVAFELNPDGSTGNVKVVSSTNRALNRASVDAVSNWKFMPVDEVLTIETELAYKYD